MKDRHTPLALRFSAQYFNRRFQTPNALITAFETLIGIFSQLGTNFALYEYHS